MRRTLGRIALVVACLLVATALLRTTAPAATRMPGGPGMSYDLRLKPLYPFQGGQDGANPYAAPIADKSGDLFMTTDRGGNHVCGGGMGCGTVYELGHLGKGYTHTLLYAFKGGADGAQPEGGLIADAGGALYGTTMNGGGSGCGGTGCGTVFKLTPGPSGYTESILYAFGGHTDGAAPLGSLIMDAGGTLYGTTSQGGGCLDIKQGCGTVFSLAPSTSTYVETVLWSFQGGVSDGSTPTSRLTTGNNGTLYGTTSQGGLFAFGTVFKLTFSGSAYTESVAYNFGTNPNDGASPYAPVNLLSTGDLLGTTVGGGANAAGTIYKLTPGPSGYAETLLIAFKGGTDGASPYAGLTPTHSNTFFGTTYAGGGSTACAQGCGTVFELKQMKGGYSKRQLVSFAGGLEGSQPFAGLLFHAEQLYGTTLTGGGLGVGVVYRLRP